MGIITWMVLGLIAGALAKWIMPGRDGGGLFLTMLLGIAGAVLGGYIGDILGVGSASGLELMNIITATAGAFLILLVYRLIKQSKVQGGGDVEG
jgi:uncharacterized membrane protein YeaQ/YmgE (transglycosylase-associated protein family)